MGKTKYLLQSEYLRGGGGVKRGPPGKSVITDVIHRTIVSLFPSPGVPTSLKGTVAACKVEVPRVPGQATVAEQRPPARATNSPSAYLPLPALLLLSTLP